MNSFDAIYLDHSAATPMLPEAMETLRAAMLETGNPSSPHRFGHAARRRLETERAAIGRLLGTNPDTDTLIFTSGGTESNNLAVRGIFLARSGIAPSIPMTRRMLVSSAEHASVLEPALALIDPVAGESAAELRTLPLTGDGMVDLTILQQWCRRRTAMVAVQWVSHETGVIQPIEEIAAICRARGVPLHIDAVAAAGKIPVDFGAVAQDGIVTMAVSGHKFGAPCGVGVLCIRGIFPMPILYGGAQESAVRPGTEPASLIAAMRTALEISTASLDANLEWVTQLRDRFESELRRQVPGIVVIAADSPRSPYTTAVALPGRFGADDGENERELLAPNAEELVRRLDAVGVCCATGSACTSGSPEPSPTLRAMKLSDEIVRRTLRFSFSARQTRDEIDSAVVRIASVRRS